MQTCWANPPAPPAYLLLLCQRQSLRQALQAVHSCLLLLLRRRQLAAHCNEDRQSVAFRVEGQGHTSMHAV